MELNLEQYKQLVKGFPNSLQTSNAITQVMKVFQINTPLRISAFLARMGHESYSFTKTKEVGNLCKKYEFSKALGNTKAGDGCLFLGRGFIQITGRYNYKAVSDYFKVDFVTHPELLETIEWAAKSAGWFWHIKKLNTYADKGNLDKIILIINGGMNGAEDTRQRYVRCLEWFKKNNNV